MKRPEARADRPQPWLLVAIGLGSLAAGLSVARGLTRDAPEPAPASESASEPTISPPSAPLARAAQATAETLQPASVAPAPAAPPPVLPDVRDASASGAAPQVELGIVAYTRCDGVPQLDKRFPCPRDLRLEARVRRVINDLTRCELTPEQRGQGDLRLEFEGALPVRMRIDAAKHGGFDRDAVSRCAGPSLGDARTALRPDHMVVLFYFELR